MLAQCHIVSRNFSYVISYIKYFDVDNHWLLGIPENLESIGFSIFWK